MTTKETKAGAQHLAIQDAMLRVNATAQSVDLRRQLAAMVSGGYDYADTLHNVYADYGYPANLEFFNFWNMFRRFGVARRAVTGYVDQTWLDDPIITSTDARFNRDLAVLVGTSSDTSKPAGSKGLFRRLKGLDQRQRVGR